MKIVILDRDGVINHDSDEFIKSPEEWHPIDGSLEAISRLNQAGFRVVIATNQSGLGRGLFTIDTLNKIHEKMHQTLAELGGVIDAIFFCPHSPVDRCDCRKPRAALFYQIAKRLNMDLTDVPAIGDSLRDLQAARTAGATPILVKTGKGQRTLDKGEGLEGVNVFNNLSEYADSLLLELETENSTH